MDTKDSKVFVSGVHPLNEGQLSTDLRWDGMTVVVLEFGRGDEANAKADAFVEAVKEQNTPGSVHWERGRLVAEATGGSLDPSRAE